MPPVYLNISDYSNPDILFSYWLKRKIDLFTKDEWHGGEDSNPHPLHIAIDNELNKLRPLRTPNVPLFNFDTNFSFHRFKKSNGPKIEKIEEDKDVFNEEFLIESKYS